MSFRIANRAVGNEHPPLVIAEIGINHEGNLEKAIRMVDDAVAAGCECVKFQSHVIEDEMIPNDVISANAKESIWRHHTLCFVRRRGEATQGLRRGRGVDFPFDAFFSAARSRQRLERMEVCAYNDWLRRMQ